MINKRKGISLIVLIITIVVIIILATAIIVNLARTNLISTANEATVKQDFKTMQDELNMYVADEFVDTNGKFKAENLNVTSKTKIAKMIPSIKNSKYEDYVVIESGEIVVTEDMPEPQKTWALEALNTTKTSSSKPTEPGEIGIVTALASTHTEITAKITVTAGDIEKYYYRLGEVGEYIESNTNEYTFEGLKVNTEYTVYMKVSDTNGEESEEYTEKVVTKDIEGIVTITREPEIANGEYTTENIKVTISYESEIPEGYELEYKTNEIDWTTYTEEITITENTTVKARLYNKTQEDEKASNSATIACIDKEGPTVPTTLSLTVSSTTITAVASGSTDSLSGNISYEYSLDNVDWYESGEFTGLTLGQKYTVYAKAIDKVGNESETKTSEITTAYADWEKEAPTVTMSMNTSGKVTEGTTITIGGSSNVGIKNATLKLGDQVIYTEQTDNLETYSKTLTLEDLTGLENVLFYSTNTLNLTLTTSLDVTGSKNITNVQNYTIGSANSLNKLAELVNKGNAFEGEIICQVAECNFSTASNEFTGIGKYNGTIILPFSGEYNGNDYLIKNLDINNSEDSAIGFFGYCKNATLKNISISGNITQNVNRVCGGLVGKTDFSEIINCVIDVDIVAQTQNGTGGVAGGGEENTIKNTINKGDVVGNTEVGGILGRQWGKTTINNCNNEGDIEGIACVGGISGVVDSTGNIMKSTNKGAIIGEYNIGGIAGKNSGTIECVANKASVESTGTGYVVSDDEQYEVTNCAAAGIVATNYGNILKSYNVGSITAKEVRMAGIAGYNNGTISFCYNKGTVNNNKSTTSGVTGGIVGRNDKNINYCYNVGNITVKSTANNLYGAIAGKLNAGEIKYCYYLEKTANGGDYGYNTENAVNVAESKTNTQFKSVATSASSVTYLLNGNSTSGVWSQSSSINGGYPYLVDNVPE